MHFPVTLGGVHPHWVFETLAYAIAFYIYRRERGRTGDVISSRDRLAVIAAAAVGGVIGSRLLHLLGDPAQMMARWRDAAYLLDGKTIVGGLIGGLIAVEVVKRRLGVSVATGDVFALPLAIGIAIGRIGCFLSGLDDDTFGVRTNVPWAVDFGDGIARHPTQLYEIVFLGLLAAVLARARPRVRVAGDGFKLFMVAYLAFRLAIDGIKPGPAFGGLSVIQWACAATLLYYARHVPRVLALAFAAGRIPAPPAAATERG